MDFNKIINRIGTYSTQWDFVQDRFGKSGLLPFTISDMDIQTAPEITHMFEQKIKHGIFGYTRWDHGDYKGAIQTWYKKRFSTHIEQSWIAYAPGVIYAIVKLFGIINFEKQGITLITPCYDGFIKILNANKYPIYTTPMSNNKINWENLEQNLKQSKIFLLCNPNNPNGYLWTKEDLKKIILLCKKYSVYIISDDIHMDFVYQGQHFIPISSISEELDYLDKTIIISSSSKTFNLSGLGGAYIICPNQFIKNEYLIILKEVDSLGSAMSLHIDSLITGYNNSSLWVDKLCDYLYKNLKLTQCFFRDNPQLKMELELPKATYFAWIDCQKTNLTMIEIQKNLVDKGSVAIMDGNRYLETTPFLRLNIACPYSKVQDGLNRIKQSFL